MGIPANGSSDHEAIASSRARHRPSRWTVVCALGVVLAGVFLFGLYRAFSVEAQPAPAPSAATELGAIPIGSKDARKRVDVYLDMHCADCRAWEASAGPTLDEAVSSGRARVVYHPLAFLDRDSSTRYSTRAAAAAGCASESGVYVAYQRLLFANQPPVGEGLSEQQLIELGRRVGAGEPFAACVRDGRFEPWVTKMTTREYTVGIKVTPTIQVGGELIADTDRALRDALASTR